MQNIKLLECGEPLVPASLFPGKILVRSWYFNEGLEGSVPEAWLRESVFKRLVNAARNLPSDWHFVIWDGWRSFKLQSNLFNILLNRIKAAEPSISDEDARGKASVFVAVPSKEPDTVSGHLTGGAVDITIADNNGLYLDMGGGFDETEQHSYTSYYEQNNLNIKARDNRRLLVKLLEDEGFSNYPSEWWHFDYGNRNWAIRTGADNAIYGYTEPPFKWRRP